MTTMKTDGAVIPKAFAPNNPSSRDRAAERGARGMTDYIHSMIATRTSAVRVFGKSMYTFAGGWAVAVALLWIAEIQQHLSRQGAAPPQYAAATVVTGIIPALLIALIGLMINRWSGRAPDDAMQRREWWHAFWWSAVPNALLLITVWVMIQEAW
jgi:hypothetical protein